VPSSVEELLAHKEKAKAERARKRAAEKKARVTSDKPETKPIPRRINDNPAQLRRVMQYHHPDKNNPGADIALYRRAKNHLKALRTRERGLYWSNIERKWMKEPNDGRNPSSDREARP
jgi:hypothetical protein